MIEFIFGRDRHEKTEYLKKKISEALAGEGRVIIIIPEQEALYWDTLCASSFSKRDAFRIEALSFSRLADSIFRKSGGCARHYISKSEKALLMWRAVKSVRSQLSSLKNPGREDRYIDLISDAVSEAKMYGVSPEALMATAESEELCQSVLSEKMKDLALISSAYHALLSESFDDPEEMLDVLCERLDEEEHFKGARVFIDSFYTLTPKQINVLRRVFKGADDTYITFAYSRDDRHLPQCAFIHDYMKKLWGIARDSGTEPSAIDLTEGCLEEFAFIKKHVWDFAAPPFERETERVSFIKCADRYDEAFLAASRIKELVAKGARYSQIACICADFEPLRGITDIEMSAAGIPVYVSGRTSVAFEGALRLILNALSCVIAWKGEDVILAARTGLCSLSPEEADCLELYVQKWNISGKKMFSPDTPWEMNPQGYTDAQTEWSQKWLSLATQAKEKLIPPISAFGEAFPGTVRSCCEAAYKLLSDFDVYDKLKREASSLWDRGDFAAAQKKSQVFDAVLDALSCMVRIMGDEVVDARVFASLLRRVAENCTIGTIPDGIDRVCIGGVESLKAENVKHIIILGAKSGEFPKMRSDNGYFCDEDKKLLRSLGLELSPETTARQLEEMFRFGAVAGEAKETLTVFIPSEANEYRPSLGAIRLMKLFCKNPPLDFTLPESRSLITKHRTSGAAFKAGSLNADRDCIDAETADSIFPATITLTQSRIENYSECAFQYYCNYILGLDEGEKAEVRPAQVGTFVHSVLENFVKETPSFPISETEIDEKCDRLISLGRQSIANEGQNSYVDYIFRRVTKSIKLFCRSLNEEFGQSSFTPHSFELKVGYGKELPTAPLILNSSRKLFLRGAVDRMDIFKSPGKIYIRVVDYKTGTKKFSLTNALRGKNIQLLLYLFALCNMPKGCDFYKKLAPGGEEIVPAGAVYFSAVPGELSSDTPLQGALAEKKALDSISRTGIVLEDENIIRAMDRDNSKKYSPAYLGNKDKICGSRASEEKFAEIESTINAFVKDIGDRLVSGEASSCPKGPYSNSPCKFCKMHPICRHSFGRNTTNEEGEDNE